jgi:hypothetical protein
MIWPGDLVLSRWFSIHLFLVDHPRRLRQRIRAYFLLGRL